MKTRPLLIVRWLVGLREVNDQPCESGAETRVLLKQLP